LISQTASIQALKGQSLQLLDNASQIYDEHEGDDVDEAPAVRMQTRSTNINTHLNRAQVRDLNWGELTNLIATQRQDEAIDAIRKYKVTDLNAFRGVYAGDDFVTVDLLD
jgi:hypothetical protein